MLFHEAMIHRSLLFVWLRYDSKHHSQYVTFSIYFLHQIIPSYIQDQVLPSHVNSVVSLGDIPDFATQLISKMTYEALVRNTPKLS